eukprot:TRINITY_DN47530_c0_g1_i1.p1 TRINITY_DN47530_c0_g1~~TRINITY_DN47530_c0_g1_i1.p1  ORF type:complete len:420 (-),score=51.57 TRINITY_DN47530_c0_g1_i1:32-1291(-)
MSARHGLGRWLPIAVGIGLLILEGRPRWRSAQGSSDRALTAPLRAMRQHARKASVARPSFYGESVPMAPPGHPDYVEQVQPFANQNGGNDDTLPPPRLYLYGPTASESAREFIVDCSGWNAAPEGSPERAELVEKVLAVLRRNGFAVAEGMLPADKQLEMEQAAIDHFDNLPDGWFTSPLRAARTQVHVPYAEPWSADWLVMNDLVLQVTAKYVINNMACGRNEKEQQAAWCQWVMEGGEVDWWHKVGPQLGDFASNPPNGCTTVGSPSELGPWLGRVMLTKTPGHTSLMTRHRDIILPGPCAQLTIGVPLTPLLANNGPLGLRPRSHVMHTPGYEVVANIPHGSLMLYDSFVDHRAVENHLPRDRYVLYYEFETRGIFTGYVDGHFGRGASESEADFRRVCDPVLRRHVEAEMRQRAR